MAANSFSLKTLSVTFSIAIVAYYGAVPHASKIIAVGAGFAIFVFWLLDAQYLRLERLFRALYDAVRLGKTTDLYSMDIGPYQAKVDPLRLVAISWVGYLDIRSHGGPIINPCGLYLRSSSARGVRWGGGGTATRPPPAHASHSHYALLPRHSDALPPTASASGASAELHGHKPPSPQICARGAQALFPVSEKTLTAPPSPPPSPRWSQTPHKPAAPS